jgi:Phospholipase_D-nuclease N-terminal
MEALPWVLAVIPGAIFVVLTGSFVWAVFDVIGELGLDQMTKALWVVALFTLPIFGVLAWLYAKPRVGMPASVHLKRTL